MFTIIQSLIIAVPILYIGLGLFILSRTRVTASRPIPGWVRLKAYTQVMFIAPALWLKDVGVGSCLHLSHRDDE